MSGSIVRYGRITKRGNGYLRALLVQGAWSNDGGALRERFEYMTLVKGKSKKKAIVASNRRFAARRLGELLYTLQKKGEDYEVRHFTPKASSKNLKAESLAQMACSA
jgi:hypothetical protein